jgi:hypothetical protein
MQTKGHYAWAVFQNAVDPNSRILSDVFNRRNGHDSLQDTLS